MPGFDKTGPNGKGAMSGRGHGICGQRRVEDEEAPRSERQFNPRRGRGIMRRMGFGSDINVMSETGFGQGRGRRWRAMPEQEVRVDAERGAGRHRGAGFRSGGRGRRRAS